MNACRSVELIFLKFFWVTDWAHLGPPFHRNADDEAERYADGNVQGHDSSEQEGLRLVN